MKERETESDPKAAQAPRKDPVPPADRRRLLRQSAPQSPQQVYTDWASI